MGTLILTVDQQTDGINCRLGTPTIHNTYCACAPPLAELHNKGPAGSEKQVINLVWPYMNHSHVGVPGEVQDLICLRDYVSNSFTTQWDPVPTLDLTDIDPDILYTVELYKITCNQHILMSHSTVGKTSVTEVSLDLMQTYKAVITAKNNVTSARNGPSVEMEGIVVAYIIFTA